MYLHEAPRVSILWVGYNRRPFSIRLNELHHQPRIRLNTIALHMPIAHFNPKYPPYSYLDREENGQVNASDITKSHHLRLFMAVRCGSLEYLRLGHPDVTALMQIESQEAGDELLASYLTLENEVTDEESVDARMAANVGFGPDNWQDNEDGRIHLLAVLVQGPDPCTMPRPTLSLSHLERGYRVGAAGLAYLDPSDLLHGATDDIVFHGHRCKFAKPVDRLGLMHFHPAAPTSDYPFHALPKFDLVVFTRKLCPRHQTQPPQSSNPRSLQQLSEEAALRAVLHEDPPQYVDAIDCATEADLYCGSQKVAEDVLCFLKFDCGEQDTFMLDGLYVSPRMLSDLHTIATMGHATRPHLLVFAFLQPRRRRVGRFDVTCLPTSSPSIAVCHLDLCSMPSR